MCDVLFTCFIYTSMRYQIHKYIDVNKVIVMFMVVKNFKRFDLFMFVFCCIIFNILLIRLLVDMRLLRDIERCTLYWLYTCCVEISLHNVIYCWKCSIQFV